MDTRKKDNKGQSGCRIVATLLFFIAIGFCAMAQDTKPAPLPKVYDESVDAMAQIDKALEQARTEGKYVLCQVGGNWCPWCLRFANMVATDTALNRIVEQNYVYIHVNTSRANKNADAMKRLENPGRFGYPVFVILDENGRRLHTQNSVYLEEGKGYNRETVSKFLLNWTRKAIETIKLP